jgi:type IV pilus assembly protein PilP
MTMTLTHVNSQRPNPNSQVERFVLGIGIWKLGIVTAALVFSGAASAVAQVPDPTPAINAAKAAKAKTEAAQQKNAEALDPKDQKPATPPPAGTPGAAGAPAAPAPVQTGPGYSYDPAGRRDPFVSLSGRAGEVVTAAGARPPGIGGLLVSEVTVKGVFKSPKGLIALVQAPDNRTYIIKTGDKVFDGTVKAITQDAVVFSQDVNDPLSLVKQREVRKAIRPEAR